VGQAHGGALFGRRRHEVQPGLFVAVQPVARERERDREGMVVHDAAAERGQ
jgi:hypothetical protein